MAGGLTHLRLRLRYAICHSDDRWLVKLHPGVRWVFILKTVIFKIFVQRYSCVTTVSRPQCIDQVPVHAEVPWTGGCHQPWNSFTLHEKSGLWRIRTNFEKFQVVSLLRSCVVVSRQTYQRCIWTDWTSRLAMNRSQKFFHTELPDW